MYFFGPSYVLPANVFFCFMFYLFIMSIIFDYRVLSSWIDFHCRLGWNHIHQFTNNLCSLKSWALYLLQTLGSPKRVYHWCFGWKTHSRKQFISFNLLEAISTMIAKFIPYQKGRRLDRVLLPNAGHCTCWDNSWAGGYSWSAPVLATGWGSQSETLRCSCGDSGQSFLSYSNEKNNHFSSYIYNIPASSKYLGY